MQGSDASDDDRETCFPKKTYQRLPVRPVTIFKNAPGEPSGVFLEINPCRIDIPEQMLGKTGHAGKGESLLVFSFQGREDEGVIIRYFWGLGGRNERTNFAFSTLPPLVASL